MRYVKTAGLLALSLVAMMVGAGSTSAATLTSPEGTTLGVGAKIKARAEAPHIRIDGTPAITCKESIVEGEIKEAHVVKGTITNLTFTNCGNDTVSLLSGEHGGTLTINGKNEVFSSGIEVTVLTHGILGTAHCIYRTNNTRIGTVTDSRTSGATATLDIGSAGIPMAMTDGACENNAELTGSYEFTSPDYLAVDSEVAPTTPSGPTLTSPEGTALGAGAKLKAVAEAPHISMDGSVVFTCKESVIEGEVANPYEVRSVITSLSFSECGNSTVAVLANPEGRSGTLTINKNTEVIATGIEFTVLTHSFFLGTTHCIYTTNNTQIGTFTGSITTGGTATWDIGSAPIPEVATDTTLCKNDAELTGSYSFTSPDYLSVHSEGTSITSPKGTRLKAGAEIKAESEGAVEFAGVLTFSCQKAMLEGKISKAGGEGATVTSELSSQTFSECGNHTVEVKKPGTLEIHGLGNGNGTLTSTGAEITAVTHGVFLGTRHCIYTTNKTHIGTVTGSTTTGGTATLDIGPVATSQATTDELCGKTAEWGGSYKVTNPDSLDVDSP